MLSALSAVPFFSWMSASPTLPKGILDLAYAVIKAKSNLPILTPFLLSFINFLLQMTQETNTFVTLFVTIIKHWPLHLLEDMWMTHSIMVVAPTPLGFMESLSIELAPFYPHQRNLLPGHSFISMTLLRL